MKRSLFITSTTPVVAMLAVLIMGAALALVACGGSSASSATSPPSPGSGGGPSPAASAGSYAEARSQLPTLAQIKQHQGSAPLTAAQLAAAFAAAAPAASSSANLFAQDAVLEDRSSGDRRVGRDAIFEFQDFWNSNLTFEPRSTLVGSTGAAVESTAAGIEYAVDVLRMREGKIVADYVYYDDLQQEAARYTPRPLKTAPASSDTETASRALAATYMAALRALSPAKLTALYAPQVIYQDTGRDVRYRGASSATAGHAKTFALKGVRFRANGIVSGPGWAAVMWMRTDREGGKPLVDIPAEYTKAAMLPTIHGVSVLEIRDGKIARETIYCDHLRTWY